MNSVSLRLTKTLHTTIDVAQNLLGLPDVGKQPLTKHQTELADVTESWKKARAALRGPGAAALRDWVNRLLICPTNTLYGHMLSSQFPLIVDWICLVMELHAGQPGSCRITAANVLIRILKFFEGGLSMDELRDMVNPWVTGANTTPIFRLLGTPPDEFWRCTRIMLSSFFAMNGNTQLHRKPWMQAIHGVRHGPDATVRHVSSRPPFAFFCNWYAFFCQRVAILCTPFAFVLIGLCLCFIFRITCAATPSVACPCFPTRFSA